MRDDLKAASILDVKPLGGMPWQTEDPFLFCVHHVDAYPAGNEAMGPAASLEGRDIGQDFAGIDGWRMYHGDVVPGFPSHPHRGFETVTIMRQGFIDHSDSLGASARFGEGDVQWLTAGKGVVHSEMFPLLDRTAPNPAELFQIWLNLPRAQKMAEPYFTMFWGETLPEVVETDEAGKRTTVTLVAGRYAGQSPPAPPPDSWAARADSDVAIWTIALEAGARWKLPAAQAGTTRTLYVFAGTGLNIAGTAIPPASRVRVQADTELELAASTEPVSILLLQGRPIAEPVAQYGPFVMTTPAEIQEAFQDYRRTEFGGWPWQASGPVHAREAGRFAKYPDGRIDRPASEIER
jgi:redox-sensitive bicupin YhaK (pirin superfamily)